MNYNNLLHDLKQASPFELFRLRILMDTIMESPEQIQKMRRQLREGMVVDYFDAEANRLVAVEIKQVKRTRVSATEVESGKKWALPFYMLNLEDIPVESEAADRATLDRNSLSVGDSIGFNGCDGQILYGEIIKLNPKRAKVRTTTDGIWNVYYQSMIPIIDGEQGARHRIIDMGPIE